MIGRRLARLSDDGREWLRVCFDNHRTTEDDVRAVPAVIGELSDALLADGTAAPSSRR